MSKDRVTEARLRVDYLNNQLLHLERAWDYYVHIGDNKGANRVNDAMRKTRDHLHTVAQKLIKESAKQQQ